MQEPAKRFILYMKQKIKLPSSLQNGDSEKQVLSHVNKMCEQSLPPELFEKWVEVQGMLHVTRKALKSIKADPLI